jgi:hypothetical protein
MPTSLADLRAVQALFPATFSPFAEALKAGVKTIRLRKSSLGITAAYFPEEEAIELDPSADWKKLAAGINARRPGLGVDAENAIVFLFTHECGHARRRQHVLGMQHRNLRGIGHSSLYFADHLAIGQEEFEADEYAAERFRNWKRGQP